MTIIEKQTENDNSEKQTEYDNYRETDMEMDTVRDIFRETERQKDKNIEKETDL